MSLKGKIYQYTGIYLATREELDYVTSDEFWSEFNEISHLADDNDMTYREIQGILIGSWQADRGFYRRMSTRFEYGGILAAIDIFLLQLVNDVKYLLQFKTK